MATGIMPTVPSTGFGLNSVGVVEQSFKRSYCESSDVLPLELHESLVATRMASIELDLVPAPPHASSPG